MSEQENLAEAHRLSLIAKLLTEKSDLLNLPYRGDPEYERLKAIEVELKALWVIEPPPVA